jgi:hypothetical protein
LAECIGGGIARKRHAFTLDELNGLGSYNFIYGGDYGASIKSLNLNWLRLKRLLEGNFLSINQVVISTPVTVMRSLCKTDDKARTLVTLSLVTLVSEG